MRTQQACELPDFDAAQKITAEEFNNVLNQIGPHTYRLHFPDELNAKKARIFFIACQGSGDKWQERVASLMDFVALKKEPIIILVGGDNSYNEGLTSPIDNNLQKCFFSIYYKKELTNLNKKPAFVILGNHDGKYDKTSGYYNRYAPSLLGQVEVGWKVEKNEVLASYLPTVLRSLVEQIKKFCKSDLEIEELGAWNLPYAFYSLIIGEKEFFCINSNSIFNDFLEFSKAIKNDEEPNTNKNQVAWLKAAYKKCIAEGRLPILLSHHPADMTLGKRIHSFDAWHYTTDKNILAINQELKISPITFSFSELFSAILESLGSHFPLKLNGHDHFLNFIYDPEKKTSQLTVGGAGGALHEFIKLNHPFSGCQIQQHGFASLTFPLKNNCEKDKIIEINFYTTEGLHLKFDTTSHLPLRKAKYESFEVLRNKIISASKKFYDYIDRTRSTTKVSSHSLFSTGINYVAKGITAAGSAAYQYVTKERPKKEPAIVQDIVAFFDQYESPTFLEAYHFLEKKLEVLKPYIVNQNSFGKQLDDLLHLEEIQHYLQDAKNNPNENEDLIDICQLMSNETSKKLGYSYRALNA